MAIQYADEYSESRFLEKVRRVAKVAGREVLEKSLWLYYAFPSAPPWARGAILGALGYFIAPLDAIPDLMPIVGYTDDLGVLVAALAAVMAYVTPDAMERAARKAREWFQ